MDSIAQLTRSCAFFVAAALVISIIEIVDFLFLLSAALVTYSLTISVTYKYFRHFLVTRSLYLGRICHGPTFVQFVSANALVDCIAHSLRNRRSGAVSAARAAGTASCEHKSPLATVSPFYSEFIY